MSATESAINTFIGELKIARKQCRFNLTVFPLLAPDVGRLFHLSLADALMIDAVTVSDVDGRDGTPGLKLTNRGKQPVLVLGNEELPGARPGRTIGVTILLPGMSELTAPARCGTVVDPGSGFMDRPKIESEVTASTGGRVRPFYNLAWTHRPPSDPDSDLLTAKWARFSPSEPNRSAWSYSARRTPLSMFSKNSSSTTYGKLSTTRPPPRQCTCPPEKARRLLALTAKAAQVIAPAIGWGHAVRLRSRSMTGSALVVNDQLVHLTARRKDGPGRDRIGRPGYFNHRAFIHRKSGYQEDRP